MALKHGTRNVYRFVLPESHVESASPLTVLISIRYRIRRDECSSLTSQASCDDGVGFTCCNDDASQLGNLATSQLSLNAEAGVPYYIVDSFSEMVSALLRSTS